MSSVRSRIALFGDVGGHYQPFANALTELGVDGDIEYLPEDLHVVQVGDLVHRGPASDEVVTLVDHFLCNPTTRERWTQLVGNHEAHHLGGPSFLGRQGTKFVEWELSDRSEEILVEWWNTGQAVVAAAVDCDEYGDVLVTHAGLTFWYWDAIGRPDTAVEAAQILNALPPKEVFAPGSMLNTKLRGKAGPVWAEPGQEMVFGWKDTKMPFAQVHGHASLWNWYRGKWGYLLSSELEKRAVVDKERRHVYVNLDRPLIGIDPCFGADEPWFEFHPLVVHGTVTT